MPAGPREILMLAGGGLDPLSGGVGTLLRYIIDQFAADPVAPRVHVVDSRGPFGFVSPAAIARICQAALPGRRALVHAHMTTRGSAWRKGLLCALAHRFGLPVILQMHGADFLPFYRAQPSPVRFLLRRWIAAAGAVVVMGTVWRDFCVGELGIAPARLHVVPNGVPPGPPPTPRAAEPSLLFLGRIGPRKGVPDLIEALAHPALRARRWHATIAGDGNAALYRARIASLGLESRIDLPGWLSGCARREALARADLLILPSYHEALPMAVLEALAAGIAVIATPVGALPDWLEDGVNARLVPPGAPGPLAIAIGALLDDPATRARLAEAGRATWQAHFDIDIAARRLAALYAGLSPASARSGVVPAAIA